MTIHRFAACVLALLLPAAAVHAETLPAHLPRYRVTIDLDVPGHQARVCMLATWTNPAATPTKQLVFNAHSRYVVPEDKIGFTAKMPAPVAEPKLWIANVTPSARM